MASSLLNRRQILKGAAAVGGAAVAGATVSRANAAPPIASPADLSTCERLDAVAYTADERALIFDELEGMVDRIRRRRAAVQLTEADAPAMTFDPRLPGMSFAPQENRVLLAAPMQAALPSDEASIAFAPLVTLSRWIKAGVITSSRLTDLYLNRIQRYAPKLECFVTITADLAREQAHKADVELRSGRYRGPLHGIPYGLKDLFDTAGVRTSWGAEPYKDRMPATDATIVTRLRDAGAVMLGKTTLGALAYGDKWFGGITRNPWNSDEGASGSSAGSASATAAGLCGFAIGTETMGSIVSPSARCGATGLKPTFGRVPRTGAMPLCWSLDKAGPICRGAEDTALVLSVLNGTDNMDPSAIDFGFSYDGPSVQKEELRIGYNPAWFADGATGSDRKALATLKELGFRLVPIELPKLPYNTMLTNLEVESAAMFEELTLSGRDDLMSWQEAAAWPNTFRAARFHSAVESLQLDRFRRRTMGIMAEVYKQVDLIVCPHFAGDMLVISNFTGYPSLTLPVGMEKRPTLPLTGARRDIPVPDRVVPHAITLWGNLFREDQLIAVGQLLERSLNFAANRPELTAKEGL
ncbi:MAG: amidase [Alphaproteobacteria bacterium]|nr:MAG: amidase [Alphaproteobacteria bacterium]